LFLKGLERYSERGGAGRGEGNYNNNKRRKATLEKNFNSVSFTETIKNKKQKTLAGK